MQWKKFLIVAVFAVVLVLSVPVLAAPHRVWSDTPTTCPTTPPAAGGTAAPCTPAPASSSGSTGGLDLSGLKKVSAGTGTGTGTGTGGTALAYPIALSLVVKGLSGTVIEPIDSLKTTPQTVQVEIIPLDPALALYLNASGVSCDTLANSLNSGALQLGTSGKLPWYSRWWNKIKSWATSAGSGAADVGRNTYASAIHSFSKGEIATGTGQVIGTTVGELVVGVIDLAKGIWKGAKAAVITTASTVSGTAPAETQKITNEEAIKVSPSYQSIKLPSTAGTSLFALPEDVLTDGTIYIVPAKDLAGKTAWKISSVDGTPNASLHGKKVTLAACQLGVSSDTKLFIKYSGQKELEFGKIACTDLIGCLIEADKRFVGDLFQ